MATSTQKDKTSDSRKELLTAVDALAKRGGITRDRAITAWYGSILLGIDEDDALDAASVDGPEDGGCDFIYIDEDQETIYVLQGYVADRPDRSASVKKWNSLVAALSIIKDPIAFKHAGRPDIYDRLTEIDISSFNLVFGLITMASKSDQIDRQRESATRSRAYGQEVSFFYEYQETLFDKYLIARAADRNVPDDTLQFIGQVAELKGDFGQAVVGTVYAKELVRLHNQYANRLFEGNVRLFIGQRKGGINEKIVETAESRPGEFWALNNGITIVTDGLEAITESRFRLKQFSIVNGCQTTVSLSKAIEKSRGAGNSQVLVRVVWAKKTLLTDIVRYNNTQNPVKLSAVRLLDPIQEGLRSSFLAIEYTYAPKQEGAKLAKNSKRIELDKITQYLAAMSDETILESVTRKAELFDRSYKTIFPRGLRAEKVFLAWLIANEIESERASMLDNSGQSNDPTMKAILGIYGTPWGIYVTNHLIQNLGTDSTKLSLSRMNSVDFRNAISKYAKKAMELYAEIAVNILVADDSSNSARNEIRIRTFLEKLKKNLGIRMTKSSSWKLPKLHTVGSNS